MGTHATRLALVTARRQDGSSGRKLLRVLLAFDTARPTWTVAELAAHVGVPLSSAYRYITLLREEGLVEAAPGNDALYRLGPRATAVGRAAADTDTDLINAAKPHLLALRDSTDESAILMRRAGESAVVCIDRAESRHPVRLQIEIGQTMPAHIGSAGRVLLAHLADDRRALYLAEALPSIDDERTLDALSDESLARITETGWTESFDEFDEGAWGCAAAISDDSGVVGAIGTAGPMYRFDEPARWAAIASVRSTAEAVSAALRTPAD